MSVQTLFVGTGLDGGTNPWSTPGNITASDGNTARVNLTGATSAQLIGIMQGNLFAIPVGATINGIVLTIVREVASFFGGTCQDNQVQLLDAGIPVGDNKAGTLGNWSSTGARVDTFGSPIDLWSVAFWTPAKINAHDFGALIRAISSVGNVACFVESYQLSVYYTEAVSPGTLTTVPNPDNDFGNVVVGDTSSPRTVDLYNFSTSDVEVTAINFNGDFNQGGALPALPFTLLANNGSAPVSIPIEFSPTTEGFIMQADAVSFVNDGSVDPLDVEFQGTGTVLESVYPVSQGPLVPVTGLVGSALLAQFIPTDLNCETDAYFTRWYDYGVVMGEKTLMRMIFRLKDLGAVTYGAFLRFYARPTVTSDPVTDGSGTNKMLDSVVDITGTDDLIEVTVTRDAEAGPMMIQSMQHHVEIAGEYIEKT